MDFNKLKKNAIIFTIIGVAVLAIISIYVDFKELLHAFKEFNLLFLPIIIILAPLNYVLRYIKWTFYLRLIGIKINFFDNLLIFLSGFGMTITPGKLGELIKSYVIKNRYNIPISKTAPLIFVERITDAISMLILSCIGLIGFTYGVEIIISFLLLTLIGIIVVQNKKLCTAILKYIGKIKFLRTKSEQIHQFYESTFILFKWKNLAIAILIGVVSWGFEGLVVYFALNAMGYSIPILASVFIVSFSTIVGTISIMPGGLVVAEGSILGFLIFLNIPSYVAGGVTVITRFSTLWLGVIIGITAILIINKRGYLNVKRTEE